jgi:dTDP-4-amino-4,6-dideoxygalactose transaminase
MTNQRIDTAWEHSIYRFERPIYVTSPLLPDETKLQEVTRTILRSKRVTNHGSYHRALEAALREKLDVPLVSVFNNGSLALLTALKVMRLPPNSEVITTPFTFPATPHVVSWNGLKPVFCDIEMEHFCLDTQQLESHITPNTSAILGVHTYGFACNLEELEEIGQKHDLKVIYDGAHAFDSKYRGRHIGLRGNVTSLSFHATKLFNTFEGGALVSPQVELERPIYYARNFGIKNEEEVVEIGINGKMNEMCAAIGLLNLESYEAERARRARVREIYDSILSTNSSIYCPRFPEHLTCSQLYYVIHIREGAKLSRDELCDTLRKEYNVYPRKYFYPPCYEYTPYRAPGMHERFPNTQLAARGNLCLPFYGDLEDNAAERIALIINDLV